MVCPHEGAKRRLLFKPARCVLSGPSHWSIESICPEAIDAQEGAIRCFTTSGLAPFILCCGVPQMGIIKDQRRTSASDGDKRHKATEIFHHWRFRPSGLRRLREVAGKSCAAQFRGIPANEEQQKRDRTKVIEVLNLVDSKEPNLPLRSRYCSKGSLILWLTHLQSLERLVICHLHGDPPFSS